MTRRSAAQIAWSLWAFVLLLETASGVMAALAGETEGGTVATFVVAALVFLAFASVGALVASRRPDNPIGWLYLAVPICLMLANVSGAYVGLAVDRSLPGAVAVDLGLRWSWLVGLFLLIGLFLFFPDGKLPSSRWRPLVPFAAVWLAGTVVASTLAPGKLDDPLQATDNPIGAPGFDVLFAVVGIGGTLVMLVASLAALAFRFRRDREQREQIKLVIAAVVFVVVVFIGNAIASAISSSVGFMPDAAFLLVMGTIPAATAVAILRYRLYEIDRIVNRAVVYGLVSALLAGLYFAIVLGLQGIFSGFTRGNDLAIAGSTLAVAGLFRPVRRRIQALVDRRFYRQRYDAQQTLEAFSVRLRDEVDLETLGTDLAGVVQVTMQPAHVSLWFREAGGRE